MSDKEIHICKKCGATKLKAKMDGTFRFDGSIDMSGYYCPNCSKKKSEPDENN